MMKSLRKRFENPIVYALVLNVLMLFVSLFVFVPFFEENDDLFLSQICEGAFGIRDSHMIYSNIILGRLLTFLQGICPSVRFFTIIQYLFLFVAFSFFTYLLSRMRHGRFLSAFMLLALSYEGYVSFQYTKTAVICALIGFVLIFEAVRIRLFSREKSGYPAFVITGTLLVLFAYLLRDDGFFLGGIFAFLLGLYVFAKQILCLCGKTEKAEVIISYLKALAPAFVLVAASFFVNSYAYSSDEAWKSFMNYNGIRTDLIDDRADLLDTTVYGENLQELGVSENDAFIYITWQFGDKNIFNEELMENILNIREHRLMGVAFIKALAAHLFEELFSLYAIYPAVLVLLVLVGILFIEGTSSSSRRPAVLDYIYVIVSLFAAGCVIFYFEYSERWSHRIVSALFAALFIALIYFVSLRLRGDETSVACSGSDECASSSDDASGVKEADTKGRNLRGFETLAITFLLCINLGLILSSHFDRNAYFRSEPNADTFFEYAADNKDTLFILDTFTFQNNNKYDLFRATESGLLDNCVVIGSWYVNSPITTNITNRFGYSDPYEALRMSVGEGGVILVDNMYPERKAQFLSEHYGEKYAFEPCEDIMSGEGEGPTDYTMYRCVVNDGMD